MQALFVCKAYNLEALMKEHLITGFPKPYVVEAVIELPKKEYQDFTSHFFQDFDFIQDNLRKMFTDDEGVMHCILVKSEEDCEGVLIEAEGYWYPRYTAYCPDCQYLVDMPEHLKHYANL